MTAKKVPARGSKRPSAGPRGAKARRVPVGFVSRSEAAKRKGVGLSTVSMACRPGGPLAPAVRGRFLDSNDPAFAAWLTGARGDEELRDLTVRKRAAETQRLEIMNAKERGELISRELVRTHVFGSIESTNRRLLGDAPRTLAREIYALAKSGAAIEDAERAVREHLSSHLSQVKTTAVRLLREPGRTGLANDDSAAA